jgi:hypothetical protein
MAPAALPEGGVGLDLDDDLRRDLHVVDVVARELSEPARRHPRRPRGARPARDAAGGPALASPPAAPGPSGRRRADVLPRSAPAPGRQAAPGSPAHRPSQPRPCCRVSKHVLFGSMARTTEGATAAGGSGDLVCQAGRAALPPRQTAMPSPRGERAMPSRRDLQRRSDREAEAAQMHRAADKVRERGPGGFAGLDHSSASAVAALLEELASGRREKPRAPRVWEVATRVADGARP